MTLSAREILKQIETGNIVVDPFAPENVKGASIDVRLGRHYFTQCKDVLEQGAPYWTVRNPWSRYGSNKVWKGANEALRAHDLFSVLSEFCRNSLSSPTFGGGEPQTNDHLLTELGLEQKDRLVLLPPHEMILCHTEEFIGSSVSLVGDLRGRSSVYRSALSVSSDGNWGDPGFFGRWTLKVKNETGDIVILPVGRRIAQIVFHEVCGGTMYATERDGGKYQTTEDRERIKREWQPEMILPRLWKDRENRGAGKALVGSHK